MAEPEFFEQKRLLQRKRDGKLKVECPASYEDVDVLEMLDGIRMGRLPGWAKEDKPARENLSDGEPLRLFISYSKHDSAHKENLLKHLSGLRGQIATWDDRDLLPGEYWDGRIKEELHRADLVLYLVSANSMATGYIQNVELPLVAKRCERNECTLVPIIVDFCHWTDLDFAKRNALPGKGNPVTDTTHWVNESQAWQKVVEGIRRIVESRR